MNKYCIGRYVNTHGIKGEIRIKSDFEFKDKVFKIGNEIIIDGNNYIIKSYRVHKNFDMVTLDGINDINDIIDLKGCLVYIDKDKYLSNEDHLDEELIGFEVKNSFISYKSTGIRLLNKNTHKILECGSHLIPFELIKEIDYENKVIIVDEVEGL